MAAQPNLPAVRFDLEVRIERPARAVFAYVTDIRNLPEWQESAEAADWIDEGSRFRERRSFLGRAAEIELEVTALEQDRRFDVKALTGPVRFEISHRFEPFRRRHAGARLRRGSGRRGAPIRCCDGEEAGRAPVPLRPRTPEGGIGGARRGKPL